MQYLETNTFFMNFNLLTLLNIIFWLEVCFSNMLYNLFYMVLNNMNIVNFIYFYWYCDMLHKLLTI